MAAVVAMDIGTTRIKACALGDDLVPGPLREAPSELLTPQPGLAEADARRLWATAVTVLREVAAAGEPMEALAIANQRATVLLTDSEGAALAPYLSWQDMRGAQVLAAWLRRVGAAAFVEATGLLPSRMWSLAKILWWREQGLPAGARFATVQDWLLHRLGASDWVLDHANASLTGLMNVHSLGWDADLVRAAGIGQGQLPALAPSGTLVGRLSADVARATGLAAGMPLILGGGDQQCAALGAGALESGAVSATLGTAGVISVAVPRPTIDPRGRLVCLAHVVPGRWAVEGLQAAYGASHRWGRALLGDQLASLAAGVPAGSRGLLCMPYLAGSGAPDHDSRARGVILGLTLAHGRADVARAIVEGTTIEVVRILDAARELAPVARLVASGGGAGVGLFVDLLANLSDTPVQVAPYVESSLLGAGLLAWVGLGRWADASAASAALPPPQQTVPPDPASRAVYRRLYERYLGALAALRSGGLLWPEEEAHG